MKLTDIKDHPDFPFSNFRDNDLQFLMLELYWAQLFRETMPDAIAMDWHPEWAADPDDGNPILHVGNRTRTPPRMLRVIQNSNNDRLPALDLQIWATVRYRDDAYVAFGPSLTLRGLDDDMSSPIEELVILSEVSNQCESLFRRYVKLWCVDLIPEEEMLTHVNHYWTRVQSSLVPLVADESGAS